LKMNWFKRSQPEPSKSDTAFQAKDVSMTEIVESSQDVISDRLQQLSSQNGQGSNPKSPEQGKSYSWISWLWRSKKDSQAIHSKNNDSASNDSVIATADKCDDCESSQNSQTDINGINKDKIETIQLDFKPDPKVVEFFQDFPEYYRDKAVRRYSIRRGWNRIDYFRDKEMKREMKLALQGRFLEDKREEEQRQYEDYLSKLETRSDEVRAKKTS